VRAVIFCRAIGVVGCGTRDEGDDPLIGSSGVALTGSIGSASKLFSACVSDGICGATMACFDGECSCRVGLVLCKSECFDIATDTNNCGACGHTCLPNETCVRGECGYGLVTSSTVASPPPTPSSTVHVLPTSGGIAQRAVVDPPTQISGGSPGTTCIKDHFEGYPERPVNSGDAKLFAGYHQDRNNWASAWDSWGTAIRSTPRVSDRSVAGDAWATTSGYSGLEYVSYVLNQKEYPFPVILFPGIHGLGDYVGIIKRGLAGGYLFPSWSLSTQTTDTGCVACEGAYWSLATHGARVSP